MNVLATTPLGKKNNFLNCATKRIKGLYDLNIYTFLAHYEIFYGRPSLYFFKGSFINWRHISQYVQTCPSVPVYVVL